ncbi:S41 family peptidase [Sphingomonas sp. PP-CE-1G-424]|uniref:S41 family peptidase n=1 Tax=Sphingomonas sp. PP-CE-1G-424 TaxID=2135658 RepID=UPI001054ECB7|nr:S41 family peptidase [Sphingomonas sp. PP-CE-1G-424]TCP64455.1 peptidase S41-like protein [Sphingomonas sp. PP-CE-1G-424]
MGTLLSAALMALASSGTAPAQTIAPGALQADLRFALDTIERQHPDLAHSVTKAALERGADRVRAQLDHPMDQAEAWAKLAQLNPVLADGHLFIGLPDWRGQGAQAVRQGTGFFPFEVAIDARDHPVIVSMLGGGSTPLAGRRILRIGGHDARHVAGSLLARTHGDTPAFRRALLAQRWWLFQAKLYGTPADYDLVLSGSRKRLTVPAEHTLPAILQRDASFDRLFACRIDTDKSARLTVASFVWEDKARFFQFTNDCFARIKAASVDRLVIDVSANGGGDDDMWKDGILRYVATQPYKQGSTYLKREGNGAVISGSIESATQPAADEPLRFAGKVTVEIGPLTYSSAVLFANVVRDYRFGVLAGVGGAARTQQSGGVRSVTLPNTGLILSYPRFVLDPPAGSAVPKLLQPMMVN